jgi:hypothetical protein
VGQEIRNGPCHKRCPSSRNLGAAATPDPCLAAGRAWDGSCGQPMPRPIASCPEESQFTAAAGHAAIGQHCQHCQCVPYAALDLSSTRSSSRHAQRVATGLSGTVSSKCRARRRRYQPVPVPARPSCTASRISTQPDAHEDSTETPLVPEVQQPSHIVIHPPKSEFFTTGFGLFPCVAWRNDPDPLLALTAKRGLCCVAVGGEAFIAPQNPGSGQQCARL